MPASFSSGKGSAQAHPLDDGQDLWHTKKRERRIFVFLPVETIGKCIYCRSVDDLSDEHVIPYSLGGDVVLKNASCGRCRDITSSFETHVTRDAMRPVRTMMGVKTRRKKDRPSELPVAVAREGARVTELVSVSEYVGVMPFVDRGVPGYLARTFRHALGWPSNYVGVGAKKVMRRVDDDVELARKLDTEYLAVDFQLEPKEYGRMIAKIAYGFAVLRLGLNQWEEIFVLPAILGEKDDIWHWVGSVGTITRSLAKKPEHGSYHINNYWVDQGHVLVTVQLFANGGLPEYLVVVGKLREVTRAFLRGVGAVTA